MAFDEKQRERGHLALKIKGKILNMLKNDGNVDIDAIKDSDEAKRLAELGVDVDSKINELINKARKSLNKKKESVSGGNININVSPDIVKQAVNECMQGQCDLLNNLISKVDSFNDVISHIKNEISELKSLKERIGDVNVGNNDDLSEKILNLEKKIESLQKISDDVANKVKDTVNPEIENIAKETINALLDIKKLESQSKEEKAENDKNAEKIGDDNSIIVSVKEAIKDSRYRNQLLKEIEEAIQEDPESFNAIVDLVNRCKAGDQEACNILQNDKESDIYNKVLEMINKVDKIIESKDANMNDSKEDISEVKTEGKEENNAIVKEEKTKYKNPLDEIIFGRA